LLVEMLALEESLRKVTLQEARTLQRHLRDLVVECEEIGEVRFVAAVDISGLRGNGPAAGAAILVSFPDLRVVEQSIVEGVLEFPYVPGFLSFREAPLMLEALRGLKTEPDVVIVEGHGKAHPRGLGIASHLGLILGKPTIGLAKSRLVGHFDEPSVEAGSASPLVHKGEVVGKVLRTKAMVKPVFVSVGNMISLPAAVDIVTRCTVPGQRLPEPLRLAHIAAGAAREKIGEQHN
jgi:deoxyribonuclease V